jgi:hypothetical protein
MKRSRFYVAVSQAQVHGGEIRTISRSRTEEENMSIVDAVTFDLSKSFPNPDDIRQLVTALGNPSRLAEAGSIDQPTSFWLHDFDPWLQSNLQVNLEAVYEAHGRLRPGESRPGTPRT